ncbi:MAG: phosphoribosylformylglycinamidine synthase [Treponema sp.]|nr:phosphoribosylformylglycinamidine synthase [Treponema sp.]
MIRRIFVEKKQTLFNTTHRLKEELNTQLHESITNMRFFIRYDIEGLEDGDFTQAVDLVFSEPPIDDIFYDHLPYMKGWQYFTKEYVPGQYDARADAAAQCVQLLTMSDPPIIRCAEIYAFQGAEDIEKIIQYIVNPVDSRVGSNDIPKSLVQEYEVPGEAEQIKGFCSFSNEHMHAFHDDYALAMDIKDLYFIRDYFLSQKRDPTETEIRVLDTYWSDHCRHTTFLSSIESIKIESPIPEIEETSRLYESLFIKHHGEKDCHYKSLMDMALMGLRELKSQGGVDGLDESGEINACSIRIKIDTSGGPCEYLVMFKNETHNHPTEIEPYGGAATCLGGAIRDPLSGRSYVYQAMRVSGAGDITMPAEQTLQGRIPQRIISKEAARGFSSYGNQIGLATGMVAELYHPGFAAKRLEAGFVIGAVRADDVQRAAPEPGDLVLLIGGETGRDGCGGATGSSKAHTTGSIEQGGAEVQKGNPLIGRKIQRLFRNKECSKLIKRSNDFGAGGICVALGELSDGIRIYLDRVPKKYEGLSATELAISESQERMAVVIAINDLAKMMDLCAGENLKASLVAEITDSERMIMTMGDKVIVDLHRSLLSSNGVRQNASGIIRDPIPSYMDRPSIESRPFLQKKDYPEALRAELKRLNVTSNIGMAGMFDSTIGSASIYMPFGGKEQLCPALVMAAFVPVFPLDTNTATVASWAYDPYLMSESPFIGAQYAILVSVAKVCAAGAPFRGIKISLQEYFKKLGKDPLRWGEPLSAMLGALKAQLDLGIPAIGGKDSMSGTFMERDVPPTLISFAVAVAPADTLIQNVLYPGAEVYRISLQRSESGCPDYKYFNSLMETLGSFISQGKIRYCTVVEAGGAASAIVTSCLGNALGFCFQTAQDDLFYPRLGDLLIAGSFSEDLSQGNSALDRFSPEYIGRAGGDHFLFSQGALAVKKAESDYLHTLQDIFPYHTHDEGTIEKPDFHTRSYQAYGHKQFGSPQVLIPVFPGTNCEYDTAKKFLDAGAKTEIMVFKNLDSIDIHESVKKLASLIHESQILALPGGFSGGDEPDGSAKFIAAALGSPRVKDAIMELLEQRGGLILGICNGFQALIKLGLLPFGNITPMKENSPTLSFNKIGRHVSVISAIRVASIDSPWLSNCKVGDIYMTPLSHGEGRFIAPEGQISELAKAGRICTQYVDPSGTPTLQWPHNPNGSAAAVEGLLSPCGRILGKMGHTERTGKGLYINVPMGPVMDIFSAGVRYFS